MPEIISIVCETIKHQEQQQLEQQKCIGEFKSKNSLPMRTVPEFSTNQIDGIPINYQLIVTMTCHRIIRKY